LCHMFFLRAGEHRPPLAGATYVEVGCGSLNPFGTLFVFQMLGARRGIAVDLDEIVDLPRACVALAELAGTALLDPAAVLGDYPITPEEILRNLRGYDLARLRRGDPRGLDPERMEFRRDSVLELTLDDACADVVLSNAFLEHVPQVERAMGELARITKPGGMQVHNIDMSDHRRYHAPRYELDFLREVSQDEIVFCSNRVRLHEFEQLFAAKGLSVLSRSIPSRAAVDERTRASFAPHFRAMSVEQLEPVRAVFFLGK
jgi:SAM-dependent methyltransferase